MISKFFIYYNNDVMINFDLIHGFEFIESAEEAIINLISIDGRAFTEISFECPDGDNNILQKVDDIFEELCLFKAMVEYKKENNDTLTIGDMSEFKHLHPMGKYPNLIRISLD